MMLERVELERLKKKGVEEIEIYATISKFSSTTDCKGLCVPTMCLQDIRDAKTNKLLADHSWAVVRYKLGQTLAVGKKVHFLAEIYQYGRGKIGIGYLRQVPQTTF